MTKQRYQPDFPTDPIDLLIAAGSGPEPEFDAIMQDFLAESHAALQRNCQLGGLLAFASLGFSHPWLYRLTFRTRGMVRDNRDNFAMTERHVVALRFGPDFLRNTNRFDMLRLIEPAGEAFHPNISPGGAICVEVYPGEPLVEICQSLHDLFRWRLRQYDERDALNPDACAWGRQNIHEPIDDRPLFGKRLKVKWQPAASV